MAQKASEFWLVLARLNSFSPNPREVGYTYVGERGEREETKRWEREVNRGREKEIEGEIKTDRERECTSH